MPAHELIAARARTQPDATAVALPHGAVTTGPAALTYAELSARIHRLAHALIRRGVRPGETVAVALHRGIDYVVAVFGVQAAGAACLPVSPDDPPARVAVALGQAGVRLVVTAPRVVPPPGFEPVDVTTAGSEPGGGMPDEAPGIAVAGTDPAFVFATSGSTGNPKGVVLSHAVCVGQQGWVEDTFRLTPADRHLFKSAVNFVSILRHLVWPLLSGGTMVVAEPGRDKDIGYLTSVTAAEQITVTTFFPSILRLVLDRPESAGCTALREVVCGGELLPEPLRERMFAAWPQARLHNVYGMTEAPLVSHWECRPGQPGAAPIGRPIPGTVAKEIDGDLYVGGQIASGYLGGVDADRFRGPFDAGDPPVLFATGDAVRWLEPGVMGYLGRTDDMVKVRGYRIETGEVAAALSGHPQVAQAVVTARAVDGAEKRLVGYAVPVPGATLSPGALREFLAGRLPAYMVPNFVVVLDELPLLRTGKVDRQALPAPAVGTADGGTGDDDAPRDKLTAEILDIWREVLGVEGFGARDRFADLGGDSMQAVLIARRVETLLGRELPFDVFVGADTVAELAAACNAMLATTGEVTSRG